MFSCQGDEEEQPESRRENQENVTSWKLNEESQRGLLRPFVSRSRDRVGMHMSGEMFLQE